MGSTQPLDDSATKFKTALEALTQTLTALDVPSAVIGGIAVNAHGALRSTGDIDAVVQLAPDDVERVIRVARKMGIAPRVDDAVAFAKESYVILLRHSATQLPLDVSLAIQQFEIEALGRVVRKRFAGVEIAVPDVSDLIIYKMIASRPGDLKDVQKLLLLHPDIDTTRIHAVLRETDALLDADAWRAFEELYSWSRSMDR